MQKSKIHEKHYDFFHSANKPVVAKEEYYKKIGGRINGVLAFTGLVFVLWLYHSQTQKSDELIKQMQLENQVSSQEINNKFAFSNNLMDYHSHPYDLNEKEIQYITDLMKPNLDAPAYTPFYELNIPISQFELSDSDKMQLNNISFNKNDISIK
jgi:hypothetical protein